MDKTSIQKTTKIRVFGTLESPNMLQWDFRVLLWNIHKCLSKKLPEDMNRLLDRADIVLFQEALFSEKWEGLFEKFDGFGWGFFKGFRFPRREIFSGVMTGSRYTMSGHTIHSTTDQEPILRTHKSSGLSYFPIAWKSERLLIINTHAMNFNFGKPFRRQLEETLLLIRDHIGPMIWAGDFNTWSKARKRFLLEVASSLGLSWMEPMQDTRFLKLDHILYRGIEPLYAEVIGAIKSSDHKPILAGFRMG